MEIPQFFTEHKMYYLNGVIFVAWYTQAAYAHNIGILTHRVNHLELNKNHV